MKSVEDLRGGLASMVRHLQSYLPCLSIPTDERCVQPGGKMTRDNEGISRRAQDALVPMFSYMEAAMEAMGPKAYNAEKREDGYICLAVAENPLNFDMLRAKLETCEPLPSATCGYVMTGYPPFLQAVAQFMSHTMVHTHTVQPDHLMVASGCGAVLDNIFWGLCNPGDAVIIPTPCYPAFKADLTVRDGCHIVYTKTHPEYRITEELLQEAYDRGVKETGRVKALLITNPNNPVGHIYSRSELAMIVQWASERGVHIVSDEIYANSVFNPNPDYKYVSMADVADLSEGLVHIIWGFSKDFGINGFRVGILYTQNSMLFRAVASINAFTMASNQTQHALACLLNDQPWVDSYLAQSNAQVLKSWKGLSAWLDEHQIPYVTPLGAQFCWMDLRKFLPEQTWDGEAQLFKQMWKQGKVVMTPGHDCLMDQPGYFRCCFASRDLKTLQLALSRLEAVLVPR